MRRYWRNLILTVALTLPALAGGRVVEIDSPTLGRSWRCSVYLPAGYDSTGGAYPVLYLLHGSGGDEHGWDVAFPVLDSLIASGAVPPLVAVAPASGTSWWVDGREPFESAFLSDLIPEIERRYAVSPRREHRWLAGYSMGGYGALRYALAWPEVFSAATLLSAALYDALPPPESSARGSGAFGEPFESDLWIARNYPAELGRYLRQPHRTAVYIACGDDDWNHPEGFRFNMEYQAVLLYAKLNREAGSPAELRIVDGGHDWDVWMGAFVAGLRYMAGASSGR